MGRGGDRGCARRPPPRSNRMRQQRAPCRATAAKHPSKHRPTTHCLTASAAPASASMPAWQPHPAASEFCGGHHSSARHTPASGPLSSRRCASRLPLPSACPAAKHMKQKLAEIRPTPRQKHASQIDFWKQLAQHSRLAIPLAGPL